MLRYLLIAVLSVICGLMPFAAPSYAAADKITAKDWINLGLAAIEQQKYYAAASSFTNALELEPQNAETYFNRALAYTYQGEVEKGIADMSDAIKYAPEKDKGGYYTGRGLLYQNKGKNTEAVADYKKALTYKQLADEDKKLCQDRLAALTADSPAKQNTASVNDHEYYDKALAAYKSGNYKDAIKYATTAIDKKEPFGYFVRASAYRENKNYPESIADFTSHINSLTDDADIADTLAERGSVYIDYANTFTKTDDKKSADLLEKGLNDYISALKKDKTSIKAGYRLAEVFVTFERYKTAKTVLDDLITNNPEAAADADIQELKKEIEKNL